MRHASALAASAFEELPIPRRAASQLRLALDLLDDAPVDLPDALPLRAHARRVRIVLHPRFASPEHLDRVRMADGSPAPRRADFYEWIRLRRRRAQMAARRALDA